MLSSPTAGTLSPASHVATSQMVVVPQANRAGILPPQFSVVYYHPLPQLPLTYFSQTTLHGRSVSINDHARHAEIGTVNITADMTGLISDLITKNTLPKKRLNAA